MANTEQFLVYPIPMPLPSGNNTFVSNWADKRSSAAFGLSVIFYGATAPDGYAWLEVSNAPVQTGSGVYGQPTNGGDDAAQLIGTQQTIQLNPITGLYGIQWQVNSIASHFVRVRYTANTNISGLTVNVYFNGVMFSN